MSGILYRHSGNFVNETYAVEDKREVKRGRKKKSGGGGGGFEALASWLRIEFHAYHTRCLNLFYI
jgi:hypothetical protein